MGWKLLPITFIASALVGCTNVVPEIKVLSAQLDAPVISNNYILDSSIQSFPISGSCDVRLTDLEISLDQQASWQNLSTVAVNPKVLCSTQKTFRFDLNLSESQLQNAETQGNSSSTQTYTIYLRGRGPLGITRSASFTLEINPKLLRPQQMVAGSTGELGTLRSAHKKVRGHIVDNETKVMQSLNYRLRGTASVKFIE